MTQEPGLERFMFCEFSQDVEVPPAKVLFIRNSAFVGRTSKLLSRYNTQFAYANFEFRKEVS